MGEAPPPPAFLRDSLRRGCRGEGPLLRRCERQLPAVWVGLRRYTGRTLASPLEWEEHVTYPVLQRWYLHETAADRTRYADPRERRMLRYTLNRLLLAMPAATHRRAVQDGDAWSPAGGGGGVLRPTQHQESAVVAALAASVPLIGGDRRLTRCLRRFVVYGPYFDAQSVRTVTEAEVLWWLRERRPLLLPDGPAARDLELRLWCVLRSLGPVPRGPPTRTAPRRWVTPLLCHATRDGVDTRLLPEGDQIFFRHWFADDELAYLRTMQARMAARGLTAGHTRQLWDAIRHLWQHASGGPGTARAEVDVTNPDTVWRWLLAVYRRRGGGDGGLRLPSVCVRALGAARLVLEVAGGGWLPTRTEYTQRLRAVMCSEEPLRDIVHTGGARGRTYTPQEVADLLRACGDDPRDRLLMLLLQHVGLRNAALRQLRWRNITQAEPPHAPRDVGEAVEKGGAIRSFVLRGDDSLCSALERYLAEYRATVVGWCWETACLFPRGHTQPDVPMTAGQIHYWFRQVAARAGVRGPHVTLHHMRHHLVTALLEQKENRPLDVAQFIGHRSLNTTVDWYWHVDPVRLHERLTLPWSKKYDP